MIVVGAVGMPCSGKGEVASVAEKMGFKVFKFRHVVEAAAKEMKIDKGPLTLTYTGDLLRKRDGPAVFAKGVAKNIMSDPAKPHKVFVEGVRTLDEMNYLRKSFDGFYVIGVAAGVETRLKRALERKRWDDPKNMEDLKKKDEMEKAWGVPAAMEEADFVVENETTLAEFSDNIKSVLKRILVEHDEH